MSEARDLLLGAAALVVAISTISAAVLWLLKPRVVEWVRGLVDPLEAKVSETHKQVTQNSHAAAERGEHPTLLDLLDDVRAITETARDETRAVRDELAKEVLRSAASTSRIEARLRQNDEQLAQFNQALRAITEVKPETDPQQEEA